MLLLRTSQQVNLSTVANNVNLYTSAGSPVDARNVLFFNTANKNAANAASYAMRLGTTWKGGSTIYLRNTATITGATGANGANGAGGAGGQGGGTSTGGNPGAPGSTGSKGVTGGSGNTALFADTNSNVSFLVDNTSGTITGGSGGSGGQGGGGGGGGGGIYYG